jgi:hypothetical protein
MLLRLAPPIFSGFYPMTRTQAVRPDWANFRHLGDVFRRWANFFLKNIVQMIWAQFFSKILPKIHLNKLQIWATFCLKIPKF